ncbi:unnamed protein product [Choristocarpus tenellus]
MPLGRQLYVIHCIDDDSCGRAEGTPRGGSVKRISAYPAHKEYQRMTSDKESPHFITKICAGPMVEEDDKYMLGSAFVVESTRAEAETFVNNDPFSKGGVWKTISINRYMPVAGIKPHGGNL